MPALSPSLSLYLLLTAGLVIAVLVAVIVVLWRLRSEQVAGIAAARAQLQNVLDAATQISIVATDDSGFIRVFNAGAEQMLGYRASEIVGIHTPEKFHDPAECAARAEQLTRERGRPVTGSAVFVEYARDHPFEQRQWTYVRKDGSRLTVDLIVTAVRDTNGRISGFLGLATDITARKRLEAELRSKHEKLEEQTRRAEDANHAKSQFLAAMSHEIRTPMNAILGMADLLCETSLDAEQREYVELFQRAGNNLLALINDILDLSKIESGRFELETVPFVLDDLVDQTIELMEPRAREKGIALTVERASNLPASLAGDPLRLRQVLVNLLGNAVKFTNSGEIALAISRDDPGAPGRLTFAITDTGIGIPQHQIARIFDDFTQGDASTSRHFGGTGLGLAISNRLVELMGGAFTVTSEVGVGSTFTFTAMFEVIGEDAGRRERDDPHGHRAAPAIDEPRPLAILVAEDYADNRVLIQAYLKGSPHHVEFAEDGRRAIDLFAQRPFDLVLMDIQMPGIDGLEATRAIRRMEESRPLRASILALSANARPSDIQQSREAGCDGHLSKPISKRALLAVIHNCAVVKAGAVLDAAIAAMDAAHVSDGLEELRLEYLDARRREIAELQRLVRANDMERVRVIGHNLAGSGSSYGLDTLSDIGRALENAALAKDADEVRHRVATLRAYLDREPVTKKITQR
jgi:PAS domain S-box-containing protein